MILRSVLHAGARFTLEQEATGEHRLDLYVIRDDFGALYAWTEREPAEHYWATLFHKPDPLPGIPSFQSPAERNAAIISMVEDHLSYGEVGLRLGLTESVVAGVVFRARATSQRAAA